MKVTEEKPGVFRFQNGTAEEDAEIIRKARALLAETFPDALPDFERGMRMIYGAAVSEADADIVLPPLPASWRGAAHSMQGYARAAVLADRARRTAGTGCADRSASTLSSPIGEHSGKTVG